MAKGSSSAWSSALAGGGDAIVAPATPPGRGALAIVRVSGAGAFGVVRSVCRGLDPGRARRAQLVVVTDADGGVVDRAVAIPYAGPSSFTGEDMVELVVHGSPVVVEATVGRLATAGARLAEPGEFTRRAVANGKLDLVQAEAIADLVAADTARQARAALRQQDGALSARFEELRLLLVEVAATLEATIDFAEQGIDHDAAAVGAVVDDCVARIDALLATAAAGRRLRQGATVVLAGAPNAGKSTLFNRLVGTDRAIVSATPGTTRDTVEAWIELAGVPVRLIDTAGLQATDDSIEVEGVRRARAAAADADGVVLLWAVDRPEAPDGWTDRDRPGWVRVRSKVDLGEVSSVAADVRVSASTGEGLEALREAIGRAVGIGGDGGAADVTVGERHRRRLEVVREVLGSAPLELPEIAAGAVRDAVRELEELVGRVDDETVLDEVFRRFCIGK